jgi:hypothetical protein
MSKICWWLRLTEFLKQILKAERCSVSTVVVIPMGCKDCGDVNVIDNSSDDNNDDNDDNNSTDYNDDNDDNNSNDNNIDNNGNNNDINSAEQISHPVERQSANMI